MKKILLTTLALAATSSALWAQEDIDTLTNALGTFVDETPASLPFAAAAGIDWSNAYIGNLLDSDFPFLHLGLGVSAGATTIPGKAVKPLVEASGGELPDGLDVIPLPFVVVNARLGGLFLPFDVGLKVATIPQGMEKQGEYTLDYTNLGLDVRYDLVKEDFWLPDVSVGVGVNYLKAGAKAVYDSTTVYSDGTGRTLTLANPTMELGFKASTVDLKAQVSKTLLWILTPYAGTTLSFGSGSAAAHIGYGSVSDSNDDPSYWSTYGFDPSEMSYDKANETGVVGWKIYGGTSLNVLFVKVDVQGMYNILDGAYGGSVGARIQL